jgi:hypothetical protein
MFFTSTPAPASTSTVVSSFVSTSPLLPALFSRSLAAHLHHDGCDGDSISQKLFYQKQKISKRGGINIE